jgi:cell wall-associated NlpC family hydrolase
MQISLRWMMPGLALAALLAGCGSTPTRYDGGGVPMRPRADIIDQGNDAALFALGLVDIGYRFGGKSPEAGLDCSGMVTYVYQKATGLSVTGSAADIARRGQEVNRKELRPGDLLFFNTLGKPFSHVAIYIGDNRFVHAPNSRGSVRIDRLDNKYYATRFQMARSYFDNPG